MRTRQGEVHPIEITAIRVGGHAHGRSTYLLACADVHARQNEVRRLAESRERIERSCNDRTALVAALTGEIAAPLEAVRVALGLLDDRRLPHDLGELVRVAASGLTDLRVLAEDVLTSNAIAAGGVRIATAEIDLVALASSVVEEHALAAHLRAIRIDLIHDPLVDGGMVADAVRLRQAIACLVAEAVRTCGTDGRVELELVLRGAAAGRCAWSVLVRRRMADATQDAARPPAGLALNLARSLAPFLCARFDARAGGDLHVLEWDAEACAVARPPPAAAAPEVHLLLQDAADAAALAGHFAYAGVLVSIDAAAEAQAAALVAGAAAHPRLVIVDGALDGALLNRMRTGGIDRIVHARREHGPLVGGDLELLLPATRGRVASLLARLAQAEPPRSPDADAGDGFHQSVIDCLPDHICVIDLDGRIRRVNRAWADFACANGGGRTTWEGRNYLDACWGAICGEPLARDEGEAAARRMFLGLRDILAGRRQELATEYPCHSPTEDRWFLVRARPLVEAGAVTGAVVSHTDITARKLLERDQRSLIADMQSQS